MMKYNRPRGTKDVYGREMDIMTHIKDTVFRILKQHGYTEIRTPMFEASNLYLRSVGEDTDIVNKEMYTFEDKSGRSITLRPEGTTGVIRAYIEEGLESRFPKPLKLMYEFEAFRYEKVQAGRQREFTQIGAELLRNV